jgi:hypothetical protein
MTNKNQNRTDNAHANKGRPARIPMTAGNKLHVPDSLKKEGHQYYWQTNRPGSIEQMEAAWWVKVKNDRGDYVTVPSGADTLYLMEIEKKYYDEDMERQQKLNIDATAKQAQELGDNEYVPMGKDAVTEREII